MRGYSYGSAGYGSATASGYGYATIATGLEGQPTTSKRPHRSNTFSWFPNGYAAVSSGKVIEKPSAAHQAKRSRHRAESGPPSSIFSSLQSGIYSPKGRASIESTRQSRTLESDMRRVSSGRRRSTTSRYETPRHRKSGEHKQSTRKKSHTEKMGVPRQSFASLTSRGTAASAASRRMSTETKTSLRKKPKGGYGFFSCFGR